MKNKLDVFYSDDYVVKIKTTKLFEDSNKPNLYNAHLLLRYFVVKCFLTNQNVEYAFNLYNIMQQKRVAFKPQIPKEKAYNEQVFKDLIVSIKQNGFYEDSPILINKKLKLFNGSHRLAIALYLGIEYVPVKIDPQFEDIDAQYDISWFKEQGLDEHIKVIEQMKTEIQQKYNIVLD